MKTNTKLLLILIVSGIFYLVVLFFFLGVQKQQINFYEQSRKEQTNEIVRSALKNDAENLDKLVFDYTYWDDMADYIKNAPDKPFESDNLNTITQSYTYNAVWVFDNKKQLKFYLNSKPGDTQLEIPDGAFTKLDQKHFSHFFISTNEGIYEISAASIHRSNDKERKLARYGYFFVSNYWDSSYVNHLEELTGANAEFIEPSMIDKYYQDQDDKVSVIIPLRESSGFPICYIKFSRNNELFNDLITYNRKAIVVFTIIGIVLLITLFLSIFSLFIRPLRRISVSLMHGNSDHLGGLVSRNDEFGELSRLMDVFFSQKKKLENEIKERISTELLLSENEEKFSKAFMLNPSAITIQSFQDDTLLSHNESFEKLSGYSSDDLRTKFNMYNLIGTKSWNEIRQELSINKVLIDHETELFTKEGQSRFILFSAHLLNLQQKECVLTVMTDITERKFFEDALSKAKTDAEESDRLKSFLLTNLSHEFRTPLTGILGFTEILRDELSQESHLHMINHIMVSADRLQSTFENIMDMAQIQAGRYWSRSDRVQLSPIIEPLLKTFNEQAKQKEINFNSNLDPEVYSIGDADMICRVVHNILDNAIKFTESGFIEISVTMGELNSKPYSCIIIKDTGIGIPAERIDDIFKEFRQVSEGISRDFEGSGLGLSIAKKFVELMNGEIIVTSEIQKGSTFTIYLPPAQPKKNSKETKESNNILLNVLLLDNDYFSAELMQSFLSKLAKVSWVKDEESAMKIIEKEKFSMIFLSINVNLADYGENIVRFIREKEGAEKTNIVAVIGYEDEIEKDKIINSGNFDYHLTKPFQKSAITSLVSSIVI